MDPPVPPFMTNSGSTEGISRPIIPPEDVYPRGVSSSGVLPGAPPSALPGAPEHLNNSCSTQGEHASTQGDQTSSPECPRPTINVPMSEPPPNPPLTPITLPAAPITFTVNSQEDNKRRFPTNYISTTKYTVYTFLPLNLFEQFRRLSNFYFLLNMIVSLFPSVTPVSPVTTIMPLCFVLLVAAIKDGLEDISRWREDRKANSRPYQVFRGSELTTLESKDILVGDIVFLPKDEIFPADLLLLSSSNDEGEAYIETANLDGETNLKPRRALTETRELKSAAVVAQSPMQVNCDAPNPSLQKWEGQLVGSQNGTFPLGMTQLLLRGCVLRNTEWVLGTVVYAGRDTKMMRNLEKKSAKFSTMDKRLNILIFVIFLLNVALCLLLSILAAVFADEVSSVSFYLTSCFSTPLVWWWFQSYMTYFLLLSFMIPISLFVTIELCKAAQGLLMEWDVKMSETDEGGKRKLVKVKTTNLNEDLAQISYIFTDKTGTLTENRMKFAQCHLLSGIHHDEMAQPGGLVPQITAECSAGGSPAATAAEHSDLLSFVRCLLLCNTVVLSNNDPNAVEGSSQDEVALVKGMMANQCFITQRTSTQMSLRLVGHEETYTLEDVLEFTPERKRMSVIVRRPDGTRALFVKGADSHMLPVTPAAITAPVSAPGECATGDAGMAAWKSLVGQDLDQMSRAGLRTLVVGMRELSEAVYSEWKAVYHQAQIAMTDRQACVDRACCEIEKELSFLGCTGIEDKLQERVPETIEFFLSAGVVVWILTGDKRETAVNIASSCRLVTPADHVVNLDAPGNAELCASQLQHALEEITANPRVVAVADGPTLETVFRREFGEAHPGLFMSMAKGIRAAVCCRLTPLQKATVVRLFQKGNSLVCMAVGDGANDVSMIQEARVGIGIMGLEGSQAELVSDYAIPAFRHLVRLCAVHGRFSLIRNAFLIEYSIYKNNFVSMIQIFFSFYNGFTGQTIFDDWVLACMNLFFTQLPPLLMGIFEKDMDEDVLERDPQLYSEARDSGGVTLGSCSLWALTAVCHSALVWFGCYQNLLQDDFSPYHISGMWAAGNVLMTLVITMCLAKACVALHYWNGITVFSIVVSLLLYVAFLLIYSAFPYIMSTTRFYTLADVLFRDIKVWGFIGLFAIGYVSVVDFGFMFVKRTWFPSYHDLVRGALAAAKPRRSRPLPAVVAMWVGGLVALLVAYVVLFSVG